jgi:16S rRNA (cytosine1402-N4)-methyltransferase
MLIRVDGEEAAMARGRRSTPPGGHRPVLLDEVLAVLAPRPGAVVVDCTVGRAGHAVELLRRAGPTGRLVGLDIDAENHPGAREQLEATGLPFSLHHANFAGLAVVLAAEGLDGADAVLADLGMSSMQVDDPGRGFSYSRDGPLDMRLDRGRGRTAADILATIGRDELARALHEVGDEPEADRVADRIVAARGRVPLQRTGDLARLLLDASRQPAAKPWRLHPAPGRWQTHPAARVFQALRILVNRELANLAQLLRVLPGVLRPGGTAALISFHSGEDRLVKAAFRDGLRKGLYSGSAPEPVRPGEAEKLANPRSRSAKLRWAHK